ncbi:DUF2254 family protein [uncultured Methanolobus sp.]|uniref:DUF2254 family protein n=1 Tax=uncultured Methanolobus sp. TaxID=218300 RepID=UPI002AAADB3E|nr:DUF2254 family protein [uncultured Methanolobus sp.]
MNWDNFKKELPVWRKRIWAYSKILIVIAIFAFILWRIPFTHILWTNNAYTHYNATQLSNMGFYDNERYLLSALVQSLAATIALVITLSLVAVQLAAQSYSARVIDVYKRNPDMWILLCIYIFTIFYGLGLTKIVGLGILGNYMEGAIFVAYFMGFFAFVCLVPYMLKTLDLLKPSTVITLLAEEINKKNVLEALKDNKIGMNIEDNDPVQPIIDMINVALNKNDRETLKNGLVAIKIATNKILVNNILDKYEENDISKFIINHLENVGIQAVKEEKDKSTNLVIEALKEIGIESADQKYENATTNSIKSIRVITNKELKVDIKEEKIIFVVLILKELGEKAAIKNLDTAVKNVISIYEEIKKRRDLKYHQDIAKEIIINLGHIGTITAQKMKEFTTFKIITILGSNNDIIMKNLYIVKELIQCLYNIGIISATNDFESTKNVVEELRKIGIHIANKGILQLEWEIAEKENIEAIAEIGIIWINTHKDEIDEVSYYVVETLGAIGEEITKNEPNTCKRCAIIKLRKIGIKALANRIPYEITNKSTSSIGNIALLCIKKNGGAIFEAITSLEDIGIVSIKETNVARKALKCLEEIGKAELNYERSINEIIENKTINAIMKIGQSAIAENNKILIKETTNSLKNINIEAKNSGKEENITKLIEEALNDLEILYKTRKKS